LAHIGTKENQDAPGNQVHRDALFLGYAESIAYLLKDETRYKNIHLPEEKKPLQYAGALGMY
jgi:hypothetical protein